MDTSRGAGALVRGVGPMTIYLNLAQIAPKIWLLGAFIIAGVARPLRPLSEGAGVSAVKNCRVPILPRTLRKGGIPWSRAPLGI
jgi:hypothetical protein